MTGGVRMGSLSWNRLLRDLGVALEDEYCYLFTGDRDWERDAAVVLGALSLRWMVLPRMDAPTDASASRRHPGGADD